MGEVKHNHLTKDIKPVGKCPACDRYWEGRKISQPNVIDSEHIDRQRKWSRKTFGPGFHTDGIIDHIQKELQEIEDEPRDLEEWVDVIILGIDGAWRAGHSSQAIIDAIIAKQSKNENREWPDWRTATPGKAIEHIR